MTLELTAYEPTGSDVDENGYKVVTYTSRGIVAGKFQSASSQGGDTSTRYKQIGEVDRPVFEGGLHIAISATVPKPGWQRGQGWEYEVTAVGPADDPALLGRRVLIVGVPAKSFATARRLDFVEVTD